MKRIKKVFVLIQISLWILFALLAALQLSQDTSHWFALTVGVVGTCLYVYYSHFFLLTRYLGKRKKGPYFLRLTGVLLTGPFLYLFFHYRKLDTWDLFSEYYMISLISIVIPFIFLSWLARVTENLVINTVKKEQLEKQAVEAELYYLKSQINPHFLFNTLNNIHTLVYKQAPTAPEAVMQLASLMRYMIYESNAPTVPLTREMNYLQDYMSLQQLRYKQSPVVDLKIEGETEACHIAPLLFIHLLENAYKHSPARLNPGDLKVKVEVQEDILTFSVQNPVGNNPAHTLEEPGGIGLPNVRKRLTLLYPDQHTLEIQNSGETFAVVLKIQGLQLQPHERKANLLYH
ncbi:sensor histidine kinase [Flavisolibacter tropicus]|uniref:Histidine kinase n=1 Tax=Flavisolibacter tropicus TaxID=1492898 RepID=A0A172TQX6_9BACT|nr:histidine kinase [Flavisolibacter tropicus]ANE49284.1 histidine kinase [Flavisolibacter tropicus]